MNNVCLIGRLVKDPEMRYTQGGTGVCNFTLAVDRRFKSEGHPEADFINIVVWNKTAEFAQKWFAKGLRIGIVGRIQTRSWEDNDNKKHYATEVVGESVYFADAKKGNGGNKVEDEFDDSDIPF
jgi:single-strand DNA-binding protein